MEQPENNDDDGGDNSGDYIWAPRGRPKVRYDYAQFKW